MKYIVVEDASGQENIYLFSSTLKHSDMAHTICGPSFMAGCWRRSGSPKVVSAGFISYDGYTVLKCDGESTSLRVKSRGYKDTILLKAALNTQ